LAKFVQIIEFETTRFDELKALADSMEEDREGSTVRRLTVVADRERPNLYMTIVEFDNYGSAMVNSNQPQTSKFAEKMAQLCVRPPDFYNLNVVYEWEPDS